MWFPLVGFASPPVTAWFVVSRPWSYPSPQHVLIWPRPPSQVYPHTQTQPYGLQSQAEDTWLLGHHINTAWNLLAVFKAHERGDLSNVSWLLVLAHGDVLIEPHSMSFLTGLRKLAPFPFLPVIPYKNVASWCKNMQWYHTCTQVSIIWNTGACRTSYHARLTVAPNNECTVPSYSVASKWLCSMFFTSNTDWFNKTFPFWVVSPLKY